MYVLRTCAHEHDGQPSLPYGQPYFKVVGHLVSCPEKLFLTLYMQCLPPLSGRVGGYKQSDSLLDSNMLHNVEWFIGQSDAFCG